MNTLANSSATTLFLLNIDANTTTVKNGLVYMPVDTFLQKVSERVLKGETFSALCITTHSDDTTAKTVDGKIVEIFADNVDGPSSKVAVFNLSILEECDSFAINGKGIINCGTHFVWRAQ